MQRHWTRIAGALAAVCVIFTLSATSRAQSASPSGSMQAGMADTSKSAELFKDFLHYARLGRFTEARAFAKQLLELPDLDPEQVLRAADEDRRSVETLILIVNNTTIGEEAAKVLDILRQGEILRRKDPSRIKENIEKLGGSPQMELNAVGRLADSGEYAIPWMVRALQNEDQRRLWPRILRAFPKIGKPAVSPLVEALKADGIPLKTMLVQALGEIGYPQAIPYLWEVFYSAENAPELATAARQAIRQIEQVSGRTLGESTAQAFFELAEHFYDEDGSVKADPRLESANVWFWDAEENYLKAVPVPRDIHGPVMAMRTAQGALEHDPSHSEAVALWLAANIRREDRLGLDVESDDPTEIGELDATRPDPFPRAMYFCRAAGAEQCHRVLSRSVKDRDVAVSLGAIAALREVAGAASLVGADAHRQALVRALQFPDIVVRSKAAFALGNALPRSDFQGSQYVTTVLSESLLHSATPQILVVDPQEESRNESAATLRASGMRVIAEASFLAGMNRVRDEFDTLSAVVLATDLASPGAVDIIDELRSEFIHQSLPVLLLVKPSQEAMADEIMAGDRRTGRILLGSSTDEYASALADVGQRSGRSSLDPSLSTQLALDAADTLRNIALSGQTVFDVSRAESSLVAALESDHDALRAKAAAVLSLLPTSTAQEAIAMLALNDQASEALRIDVLNSLAESGRNFGSKLSSGSAEKLLALAMNEPNLKLRTAASKALGALNLPSSNAAEVLKQYRVD